MGLISVIDVNTRKILVKDYWEFVQEYLNTSKCIEVPQKRLYTNYGIIDHNIYHIYVLIK